MNAQHVPAGYSGVHFGQALGIPIHFAFQADVENHTVDVVQSPLGISLKVQECQFRAIVEWIGHPKLSGNLYEPKGWHVGFVQNLTGGAIIFTYGGAAAVTAAISPSTIPCKDSGSAGTWYDPSPFNVKRFGVPEEFAADIPLPQMHPAKTNPNFRFIEMGDAPGTGAIPLTVPCASTKDLRAHVGTQYTIGWTDPLNQNPRDPAIGRLQGIDGHLQFRTCLAMSSEPNLSRLRTTTLFCYLYYIDWHVSYAMNVLNGVVTPRGARARIVQEGTWNGSQENPIVVAPDANESVCVKFL
jgi:hypothetical protein